jgi:hypothetical protein
MTFIEWFDEEIRPTNLSRYDAAQLAWQARAAQPSEPVAWRDPKNINPGQGCTYDLAAHIRWPHIYSQPLYAAPPLRTLTDEEIIPHGRRLGLVDADTLALARAIEAAISSKSDE